ncbi:uncharacterized protein LOC109539534 isoform X3 [Dendroctonus ponderosae]|uniref:uncharacterized protein LOC109539534 isoform X3 n=1 Tax=Dendroctonus ponderosae TaxID=77166 RepID=UPI002034D853|nr:uncharacterized protein LOC109539534 isoform X3 [Dendroctonus ponderosae]
MRQSCHNSHVMELMDDHKKEIDADFIVVQRKNMRRGKPQQELYKPGSGRLRRSDTGSETGSVQSLHSDYRFNDYSDKLDDSADRNRDQQRRAKKPEREFYVPRVVAEARGQSSPQSCAPDSGSLNGTDNSYEKMNRSKRYSSNRARGDNNGVRSNNQNEWRDNSPNRSYRMDSEQRRNKSPNRSFRMESEPRGGFGNNSNWNQDIDRNRERDTRSVEPTGVGNRNNCDGPKFLPKPPSGRRHSSTGNFQHNMNMKMFEQLAPRFRKKFLQEKGMALDDAGWDGNSSVYQSNNSQQHNQQNSSFHSLDVYSTLPHANATSTYNSNSNYHTLPGKPRGRGRYSYHEPEFQPGPAFRSITPDRSSVGRSPASSRPGTPTRRFDNSRPPNHPPSRSQTPVNHYQDDNRHGGDVWGDRNGRRGAANSNVFDRTGSRASEPRYSDNRERDQRNNDFNRRRDDDNNRLDRRHEADRENDRFDRGRKEHHRKGDRRKKSGRDMRGSSRDLPRPNSRESHMNSTNSTFASDVEGTLMTSTNDPSEFNQPRQDQAVISSSPAESLEIEVEFKPIDTNVTFDWNEEIELSKLEAAAKAMTRSSSVASLQDVISRSMPASASVSTNVKNKRGGIDYLDKTLAHQNDSFRGGDIRDRDFKVPHDSGSGRHGRRRRSSRDTRDVSFDRFHNKSRGPSREVSFDRSQSGQTGNWRDEIIRSRQNSEREGSVMNSRISSDRSRQNSERDDHISIDIPSKKGGLLVLPSAKSPESSQSYTERPKFPEIQHVTPAAQQKTLFDPKNPNKPILVKSPGSRVSAPGFTESSTEAPKLYMTDSSGKSVPIWYNEQSEDFKSSNFKEFLRDIKRADFELQYIMDSGLLLVNYDAVDNLRQFLKRALEFMLCKAIKFCQTENVEQHIWKILYYNIIEATRKAMVDDPDNKPKYKKFLLNIIDEGTKYFERLVGILEDTFNFKVANYTGNNAMAPHKGSGNARLALISTQKIFLFLGDLGRYKEQVNETTNYGKCRQWYIKSHEINPKNGKPYNQLAVLAVYSRRKLDAVYYYMRSLMSSNPVPSARECLVSLFDENRKKYLQQIYYEQGEKKRREERLERQRQHMKQKESEENGAANSLRKETWIRPDGGRRLHRTTKALEDYLRDSEEEDLAALSSVEVNKRFVTSYLHVHGKLITKIGMESFQDAAMQMLKEFRALLQHSPVSLPCNRFLQLLALNMFAIESTQLKDSSIEQSAGYRSELQERALIVSLQMFNLILERCLSILQEHCTANCEQEQSGTMLDSLPHDANVLLPAIKIWCDWMLCHTAVWNPPPSTHDFKVGPSGDLWSRLGLLMNILERIAPDPSEVFVNEPKEDHVVVRLQEDVTLSGFTPLILHDPKVTFAPSSFDFETAQLKLRISKLLFFGTVFLCGLEPPVLKLEIEDDRKEYVSVVCTDRGQDSPREEAALTRSDEFLLETFSGDEEETSDANTDLIKAELATDASAEIQDLLHRKLELEEKNRKQELHQHRVMKILSQSIVSVHVEIRPKNLVPDTNCFIDHLDSICTVTKSHTYTLMVPIVVLSELEGLSKGTSSPSARGKVSPSPEHVQKVAQACRSALDFLKKRHPSIKCVTTKGALLTTTNFSTEDDSTWDATLKNDDKILATCLMLCKDHSKEQAEPKNEPRHLFREVVLLTEDRNLRVKAHARDVPVRSLPDFMRWAGLGG